MQKEIERIDVEKRKKRVLAYALAAQRSKENKKKNRKE